MRVQVSSVMSISFAVGSESAGRAVGVGVPGLSWLAPPPGVETRAEGSGDWVVAAAGVEFGVVYRLAALRRDLADVVGVGKFRGGLGSRVRNVDVVGGWLGWVHIESHTVILYETSGTDYSYVLNGLTFELSLMHRAILDHENSPWRNLLPNNLQSRVPHIFNDVQQYGPRIFMFFDTKAIRCIPLQSPLIVRPRSCEPSLLRIPRVCHVEACIRR